MSAYPPPAGGWRRSCFRLMSAALVAASCLAAAEGFVRAFPSVLPEWYRSIFPLGGIELFNRGVLAATPIEGVPIPYSFGSQRDFHGGPPADLRAIGLVDPEQHPDAERYPDVHFHYDRWGLANPSDLESADVLLVGDSFTRAMGALQPAGLQARLRQRTGLTPFNLGIPSIGPQREAWLLDNLGLARRPAAVIWFFFGGNDLADAAALAGHQRRGVKTHADLFPDFIWPRSLVIDLAVKTASRQPPPLRATAPLSGFDFAAEGGARPIWFLPHHLRELTRDRAQLEADPGWRITGEVLARVAADLARRKVRLLVVYVPSKAEVYLPLVRPDQDLALRMASFGSPAPAADSAADFWRLAIANRDQLDALVGELCAAQGIDFLSLTRPLRELARRGKLGYFAADSHWNEVGQAAGVEPLARWLGSRPAGER